MTEEFSNVTAQVMVGTMQVGLERKRRILVLRERVSRLRTELAAVLEELAVEEAEQQGAPVPPGGYKGLPQSTDLRVKESAAWDAYKPWLTTAPTQSAHPTPVSGPALAREDGQARCEVCDRPVATAEQWETVGEGERDDLCWGRGANCDYAAVDWHARAVEAEADRGELQRRAEHAEDRTYASEKVALINARQLDEAEAELAAARESETRLREALARYGRHEIRCGVYVLGGIHVDAMTGELCTCGLAAVLVDVPPPQPADTEAPEAPGKTPGAPSGEEEA